MSSIAYPSTASRLGASREVGRRWRFSVWAPRAERVELQLVGRTPQSVAMAGIGNGYFETVVGDLEQGALYSYRLDGGEPRPDPASRCQPHGVHGPSQLVDLDFPWRQRDWHGLPLSHYVIYELHVGTFTPQGTFQAVAEHLDELVQLGVTAVELMPVAQFPGERNWGYDGVQPFAAQYSYGGPEGLWRLVDACHQRRLAVVLDVVYNHFGPEGNYLHEFGHYFTDRYHTFWGSAVNVDGRHSDEVRRYLVENALQWVRDFRIDALRLDATHAIFDQSARPFLAELSEAVHAEGERLNRRIYLIEESSQNDPRHIQPPEIGGYGLDAVWNDDFQHSLHALLTGERDGYYRDFGSLGQLAKAFREGFVYAGEFSQFRGRRHGVSSASVPAGRFVVCAQNHDQVGNRKYGERLSALVGFERLKLAAGLVLLSPYVPLLFMGEEYGETAPFLYFVSHSAPELVEAVRRGRKEEFAAFGWEGELPDPADAATFQRSVLDRRLSETGKHRVLCNFYRELIRLRKTVPALSLLDKRRMKVLEYPQQDALACLREGGGSRACVLFSLAGEEREVCLPLPAGSWQKALDSAEQRWDGSGSSLPPSLESSGEVKLAVGARSCSLFLQQRRDPALAGGNAPPAKAPR